MPADPFSGTRYRTVSKLSESGRDEVYVVEHIELGKSFAAKLLLSQSMQDPRAIDRFRLEAQSLGRLRHPNIVDISGFGHTSGGVPFMLMELLKGWSLEDELRQQGAIPPALACDWLDQILAALEAVHDLGIVHRDVGPRHVFLHQPRQGPRHPKLTGFGSVRVQNNGDSLAPLPLRIPTDAGVIVGDPRYSSPEAARGEPVDARGDLYQAGQLLMLMLTGPDQTDHPSLTAGLSELLTRALSPSLNERFTSAREFRNYLDRLRPHLPLAIAAGAESTLDSPQRAHLTLPRTAAAWANWAIFVALVAVMAIVIVIVGNRLRGEP